MSCAAAAASAYGEINLAQCRLMRQGQDVLFVAYYASAELGCYRVLGWPMPQRILDLFTEFRARTNGLDPPAGNGLLGALAYFGLDSIGAVEKDNMRALVLRGPPWTEDERVAILDYCEGDVEALERLLPAMFTEDRPAAGAVARPLYGSGSGYRACRDTDRRSDA